MLPTRNTHTYFKFYNAEIADNQWGGCRANIYSLNMHICLVFSDLLHNFIQTNSL